jgi:YVTN family beta-propeller protein
VDVGGWNVAGLTFNARAGVVYGGCFYGHSFFAIDCSGNAIVSQIEVVRPNDIAYAPLVNKAYCGFANQGQDSILVVDGNTHTRIKAISVVYAGNFAYDSVGNRLYFTCYSDDCVGVLDCWSDSVLCYIPIPGEPVHLNINTRHRKLYCQNDANMTVSVIDMNTNQVIRNVYTGSWYFAQCYSEVADKYYCDGAQGVAVIDGATDSVIKQIRLPQGYSAEAMVSVGQESLVMVAAVGSPSDSLFVIDVRRDSVRSATRAGMPRALAFSPATQVVYCANGSSWDNLSVVAANGSRVLSYVGVGDEPQDLLVCPAYGKLYVGHGGETRRLYVVRDHVGVGEPKPVHMSGVRRPASLVTGTYVYAGAEPATLVDACGRRVAVIRPGHNDLRALAPGVYAVIAPDVRHRERVVKVE